MRVVTVLFAILAFSTSAFAEELVNTNAQGVFINGYDVVSYFEQGEPRRGSSSFQSEIDGVTYYFSSVANKALFDESPDRFLPQYAGHCANGLSDGHLVGANPEIYRIIDGKLYLFFSWWGKAQWKFNQQEQIELAGKNWLGFKNATLGASD